MAASIAKLAIQITTDTARMSEGLRYAQNRLARFKLDTAESTASISGLNAGLLRTGLAATAAFIGVQKLGQFLKHAREASAELQDRLDAVNGTAKSAENLHVQYKRLWDTIAVIGLPVVRRMSGALDNLLGAFEAANRREGLSLNADAFIANLERREKAMADAKKAAEDMAKAEKEAAEERARQFEKLKERAQSIADSLRTPLEVMQDEQKELTELFNRAMLSRKDLERGLARTADEYRKATNQAHEFKNATRIGVAEQGSQQAASVLAAARNAAGNPVQLDPKMLAVMQRQLLVQQQTLRKPAVQIQAGGF